MALDLLMSAVAFAIIVATIAGIVRFIVDAADGVNPIEERRTPKFPCASCVHCDPQSQYRCAACCEEITGKPDLCAYARGTKECAKNARKVS